MGIESGTAQTVDLSALDNSGTDDQNLTGASFNASNILQIDIEDGTSTTVDLSALNDSGTDDQKIDTFTLTGTTLNLSVEDDGEAPKTVNLSAFATDTELAASDAADLDKVIGNEVTNATNTTLTRSGSGTAGSPFTLGVSNGGIGTTQLATNAVTNSKIANNAVTTAKILSGGNNKMLTTGATGTVAWTDTSSLNTDNQTLTAGAAPGTLSISGGNSITLNVNDADSNATNEIQDLSISGNVLRLSGDATSVTLPTPDGTETLIATAIDSELSLTGDGSSATPYIIDKLRPNIFYPPSIAIDASTTGTLRTLDLYAQYTAQFATPAVASAGAPAAIPTYAAGDLFYYVTYYDTSVFDNVSVDANGVMTYDVIAQPADYNSLINVVFVVK